MFFCSFTRFFFFSSFLISSIYLFFLLKIIKNSRQIYTYIRDRWYRFYKQREQKKTSYLEQNKIKKRRKVLNYIRRRSNRTSKRKIFIFFVFFLFFSSCLTRLMIESLLLYSESQSISLCLSKIFNDCAS